MLLGGTELTLNYEFPYCRKCSSTSQIVPVGVGHKLLVSAILFFVLLLASSSLPVSILASMRQEFFNLVIALLSLSAVFGFYAFRRPMPGQTSYCQPVRLKKVRQRFSGEIEGLVLNFTNKLYEREFRKVNSSAIASGALQIV
jgi:hypothetical protein